MYHTEWRAGLYGCRQMHMMYTMTKSSMVPQEVSPDDSQPVSVPVDMPKNGSIKRQETADILGVSVSEVRRLERTGKLRPKERNPQGVWLFDLEEVTEMARARRPVGPIPRKSLEAYTPEEAGKVFTALAAGKSLVECVLECKMMPRTIEVIAADYARLTGGMFICKETMDAINVLSLEGTFPLKSERDLLDVMKTASEDTCKKCNSRSRVFCKPCAHKLAERVAKDI